MNWTRISSRAPARGWGAGGGRVAAVPQGEGPPAGFTVEEVILMGRTPYLRRLGPIGETDRQRAAEAIRRTRVDHLRDRVAGTLSGGGRQGGLIAPGRAAEARRRRRG